MYGITIGQIITLAVVVVVIVALPHIITHYGKKNAELNDVNKWKFLQKNLVVSKNFRIFAS